jgi:hypothetical protein
MLMHAFCLGKLIRINFDIHYKLIFYYYRYSSTVFRLFAQNLTFKSQPNQPRISPASSCHVGSFTIWFKGCLIKLPSKRSSSIGQFISRTAATFWLCKAFIRTYKFPSHHHRSKSRHTKVSVPTCSEWFLWDALRNRFFYLFAYFHA